MATELQTWERDHYATGGGEPFLFYVVYGEINPSDPLSRSKYRTNGMPEGIDVMSYATDEENDVPGSFREGYIWDEFIKEDPELAHAVSECQQCIVLRGTPADDSTLNYLRDTVGFTTYLLDQGGVAVYDPFLLRWWSKQDWMEQIFGPAAPVPTRHTVILRSEEENPALAWFHTRGMLKFGRPEISVHNVSPDWETGVVDLCNRLINSQALGHVVEEGAEIRMKSLPEGGVFRHGGDLDDPDFNNVHIEAVWPDRAALADAKS